MKDNLDAKAQSFRASGTPESESESKDGISLQPPQLSFAASPIQFEKEDGESTTSPESNSAIIARYSKMTKAERDVIRGNKATLDGHQKDFSSSEFGQLAAILIVDTPSSCDDKEGAQTEARRIMTAQLANKDVARGTIDNKIEVVVIPRSKLMTDVPQFASLKGTKTFDGRTWDAVRGSGGMKKDGKVYTAITEENLLGGDTTAEFNGKKLSGQYDKGYSTTSHEFAHTLHLFVLGNEDKKAITKAYKARKTKAKAKPDDTDQWVDGKEGCYASMTEEEFFAQLSNAYLGTNAGTDPYTQDTRHNGKDWVKGHEPEMFAVLEKMYGKNKLENTNPTK